ncbi:molybdopterin-dependent oxidoreductase [Microtetraspora fusca]|uniref:Molybdopterin-dependent oxidoreductase n=1 Tax=Microtetraspora fusca TaxID=1997 RepID=A0ABW6UYI0_MICFU|nr:molybdopterin-dependent oxidoreductase [Microtetraspora fusca]
MPDQPGEEQGREGGESVWRRGGAWLGSHPPPGPFRPDFWRSPLRGSWLTSVFGLVLLVGIPIIAITGLLSYAAYNPWLPGNDTTPERGLLGFYFFDWPTWPAWLYRVTQGAHVILGLTLIPVLLAKLWSVIPKLFTWPPTRSLAMAVERASLLLLVGGAVFEFVTGVLNIQLFYTVFPFSFYPAHLYGAWIFIAAFAVHVALKLPRMVSALRSRSLRRELRTGLDGTRPEPPDPDGLVATRPAEPSLSRRGLLGFVGGGSLLIFGLSVGQTLDGPLRRTALLAPHGRMYGLGPNDFQVNKSASAMGVDPMSTGPGWRLELAGTDLRLSRAELLALPQYTYALPIACVEGWSTQQTWTGPRLADLARLAGAVPGRVEAYVESLERGGAFSEASLSARQVADHRSLLALRVNGADLSLDHGYPARIIVPNAPGVHNTKWVRRLTFRPPSG